MRNRGAAASAFDEVGNLDQVYLSGVCEDEAVHLATGLGGEMRLQVGAHLIRAVPARVGNRREEPFA
jgi:hypothetical protein